MKIEHMDGGHRLLLWRKRLNPGRFPTWKTEYYRICFRVYRDTYGLQISLTLA